MDIRETVSNRWAQLRQALTGRRGKAILAVAILLIVCAASWAIRAAVAPTYRAGAPVALDAYGLPGVELRLVYPVRVAYHGLGDERTALTVYARARDAAAVQTFELLLPLPDATIAIVGPDSLPVPGRLTVEPGYPDALPYSLLLAHADTQMQPTLFASRGVRITPLLRTELGAVTIPELSFRTEVESRFGHAMRSIVLWLSGWGLPVGLAVILVTSLWRVWYSAGLRRRQSREQRLSALYTRLRDEIKVENWPVARERAEELRLVAPAYRDLDRLDTLISTAETGTWRREQLYNSGLEAYRQRDWPAAVQAFAAIEEETPYYRDVRFLRRTAALGADLRSRDRSLRLQAAVELGAVADLLDMSPLLRALGDGSKEVADAAEASFARIGVGGFDTLIDGLVSDRVSVRERSQRLLQGMGQSARDQLLNALHSPDARVTGPVARLLGGLGAREALARALLFTGSQHHQGIIEALVAEDMAAAEPLVDALLAAPEGREGVVIRAIAALRAQADIDRYLEARLRAAPDQAARQRIQRAMRAPAEPFVGLELTGEALEVRRPEPEFEQAAEVVSNAPVPARPARRLLWGTRRRD
jgi:hypothetical protein